MRRWSNNFLEMLRYKLHDETVTKYDVVRLLKAAEVYRGKDRLIDEREVYWALKNQDKLEKIKEEWKYIKACREMAAQNTSATNAYSKTDVPVQRRSTYVPTPNPVPKRKIDDTPTSYMPDADMDRVSRCYLKNQELFYEDTNVEDDRNILEALVDKYGKEDVLKFIRLNEEKKNKEK